MIRFGVPGSLVGDMSPPSRKAFMASSFASVRRRFARRFTSRPMLLLAFAFAVMADPVSSVAYAIEAALRALHATSGCFCPL
jgi:hypothetical protein